MRTVAVVVFAAVAAVNAVAESLDVVGVTVTPHVMAESMRYRVEPEPAEGARVQLFLRNAGERATTLDGATRAVFDGRDAASLVASKHWAWHDTPSATPDESLVLAPDRLTVWTFNGRKSPFGPGHRIRVAAGPETDPWLDRAIELAAPKQWISAITFLGPGDSVIPDRMVVHIANEGSGPVTVESCRLWLPEDPK